MRIGLVTLHNSYSYGACLQAYATYYAIENMGYEPEFVNYVNKYEQSQNHLISLKDGMGFKKNCITTIENIFLGQYHNNRRAFENFGIGLKKSIRYESLDDLKNVKYDVLISGSDQLWNPDIFNGIESFYFLNFGYAKKRIAFSASAGSHIFTPDEIKQISGWLKNYDAIATRETELKTQVENIVNFPVSTVMDPTFLLNKREWLKLNYDVKSIPEKPYILLYMIGIRYNEYKEKYAPLVRYFAEELGLPVYAITTLSFPKYYGADYNLTGLTPEGLILAIGNADFVISSSFHGVAFSVNLNKKFVALKNSNPVRIENLLRKCGLENRYIDSFDKDRCNKLLNEIDYSSVNRCLEIERNRSKCGLRENIESAIY